jgi:hypothetical protein
MLTNCENKNTVSQLLLACCIGWGLTMDVFAQSGPSDLLDLTIEELFEAEIYERDRSVKAHVERDRWHIAYRYQQSRFEDYMSGSKTIAVEDVLFTPGQEPRTGENFPVVPKVITQEVHAMIVGYEFTSETTFSVVLPFVYQKTDHVSVVPGYSDFTIRSDGVGDIFVSATQLLKQEGTGRWDFSVGLSIPTGSIDEKGDTPRAPGNQQLPYSMQTGSGTYDFPLSLLYSSQQRRLDWGVEVAAKVRTGRNDRDYRLGNRFSLSSWLRLKSFKWVEPSIKLDYKNWESIRGADTDIQVPGAFRFPAPVTNPDLYGGKQVDLLLAFRFPVPGSAQAIEIEVGRPVYQSLNGPQSAEEYQVGLLLDLDF